MKVVYSVIKISCIVRSLGMILWDCFFFWGSFMVRLTAKEVAKKVRMVETMLITSRGIKISFSSSICLDDADTGGYQEEGHVLL